MKKKTVVIACALALAAFAALACTVCAFYRLPPRTDTGYSKIYTEDEILSAEETVKEIQGTEGVQTFRAHIRRR